MSAEPHVEHSASSNHGTPVNKLYRHALESIFKFCSLADLHAVLAVSRDWSAAVESMPPVGLSCGADSVTALSLIAYSRLARHVAYVSGASVRCPEGLQLLADRFPSLERHRVAWIPPPEQIDAVCGSLARLQRMKELTFFPPFTTNASREQHAATFVNRLIESVAAIPMLEELWLILKRRTGHITLTPLATLTKLRTLQLRVVGDQQARPTDDQVAAIRQMHSLERFDHSLTDRNETLRLLLQSPMPPLRWHSALVASGPSCAVLPQLLSLPALTKLDVDCGDCDVAFLLSLPRIVNVCVHQRENHNVKADHVQAIVTTLQRCPQITTLNLDNLPFTAEQIAALLPMLPRLTDLQLFCLELTSLSFLATEALASSLHSLTVWSCPDMPSAEIVHLLGLRSLSSLTVHDLREPLSEAQTEQLQAVHPRIAFDA